MPGEAPVAVTDFNVDPDILTSDIASFAWVSDDRILFSKDDALWTVSASERKPARMGAGLADAANFTVSNDRKVIAFTRGGQIWVASLDSRTQRPVTALGPATASNPVFSRDGQWIAFASTGTGASPDPGLLPFNGDRMRIVGNGNGVVAGGAVERRIGIVSVSGGDISWIPSVGNPARCSSRRTGRFCGRRVRRTARREPSGRGAAARCERSGRIRTTAGFRRRRAIRRSAFRRTGSRSRSSATARGGFTCTSCP